MTLAHVAGLPLEELAPAAAGAGAALVFARAWLGVHLRSGRHGGKRTERKW